MRKKQQSEIERLRRYIRRSLKMPKRQRINWMDDLFLADVRNTPLMPRVKT